MRRARLRHCGRGSRRIIAGLLPGLMLLLAAAAAGPAGGGGACPVGALEEAFVAGRHDAVIAAAEGGRCADLLALGARAALAQGAFLPPGAARQRIVETARALAERALEMDSDNVSALLQAAAAYGFRAVESRSIADVRRARALLERAEALAPENPFVIAAIATWHARTRLGAGGVIGPLFFGARKGVAQRRCEEAIARAPDEPAIVIGCGLTLVALGDEGLARGLALLRDARALAPKDAFTRALKERAMALLAAADEGMEPRALIELARGLLPYADRPPGG